MKIYVGLSIIVLAWGFTVAVVDFKPEKPCTEAHGVCKHKSLCQHNPHIAGLCPKQQKDGAECCHEQDETQCRGIGGECIEHCEPTIFTPIQCPGGKMCCVWQN